MFCIHSEDCSHRLELKFGNELKVCGLKNTQNVNRIGCCLQDTPQALMEGENISVSIQCHSLVRGMKYRVAAKFPVASRCLGLVWD